MPNTEIPEEERVRLIRASLGVGTFVIFVVVIGKAAERSLGTIGIPVFVDPLASIVVIFAGAIALCVSMYYSKWSFKRLLTAIRYRQGEPPA